MSWLFHSIVPARIWLQMLLNKRILLCYLNYKGSLWYPKVVLVKKVDASCELSFLCMVFRVTIWIYVLLETNGFYWILELIA